MRGRLAPFGELANTRAMTSKRTSPKNAATRAKACLRITANTWLIGLEGSVVLPLRLARFVRGGPQGAREARRMVTEKVAAQVTLLQAWQTGQLGEGPVDFVDGAARHYLDRVRANRKRLTRDLAGPATKARRS